ncbi:MAG TPA: cyclopropane-fatty-acyl-phospholipid synthase family protein [Stellaceae bacterium]|jgi:cyclopropane-fatty-acyl-phospholipid synthase|nr:cyclopropane-fatty-acyl-phospholipid synthase family protein [Stellaceae bacterium]
MLLARLLSRIVQIGRLGLIDAGGRRQDFGGATPGPAATMRLHEKALDWKLSTRPYLYLPEAYMNGTLTIEEGTLYDLLDLFAINTKFVDALPVVRFAEAVQRVLRGLHQYNPAPRAQRNVAHHYDLSDRLYDLFLDRDRQYSCAYFLSQDDDIDTAQLNKRRHIAAKLLLRPGQKVLDIGCGWGGMALYLASECGVDVTGLTLSEEQLKVAQRRAAAAGLSERVHFQLRDYRAETGQYDRIVSVGMFEHVGIRHYPQFFDKVNELLAPDGVMLLHAIGRMNGPASTNAWLRKYIFPGGYSPALSEVVPLVERRPLWVTDIEILRLHYADTLRAWRARFNENRDRIRAIYDERFCRMWETYLIGSELAFRRHDHIVWQMQIAKGIDVVPRTRDYMFDWEREHRQPDERAA